MGKITLTVYILVLGMTMSISVYALTPSASPVDNTDNHKYLVENADFIISGEVKLIQYEHVPVEKAYGTPTTLVTYKVIQVFHGQIKADRFIRLRFLGGPYENGGMLQIPFIPRFTQGDQDVLFVVDNGTADCPLVKCMQGRIRIKSGFIENDDIWLERVVLSLDGRTLYPATEPIEPGDIHTYENYRQKLQDMITSGQFVLKSTSQPTLDARTVKYTPPQ